MIDCKDEACAGVVEREGDTGPWTCNVCGETYGSGAEPDMNEVVEGKLTVDQQITNAVDAQILKRMPAIIDATLAAGGGYDDRLEIDRIADQVERSADDVVNMRAAKRVQIGQSQNVALLNAKVESGYDLTPDGYDTPKFKREMDLMDGSGGTKTVEYGESYFQRQPGFRAAFVKRVEDQDMTHAAAYEATCAEFKLETFRKPTGYEKALSEMPATARGGYLKGRAQAEQTLGQMMLEERKIDGGRLLREARGGSLTESGSPSGPSGIGDSFDDESLDELEKGEK